MWSEVELHRGRREGWGLNYLEARAGFCSSVARVNWSLFLVPHLCHKKIDQVAISLCESLSGKANKTSQCVLSGVQSQSNLLSCDHLVE